jgi:hypothetical protein
MLTTQNLAKKLWAKAVSLLSGNQVAIVIACHGANTAVRSNLSGGTANLAIVLREIAAALDRDDKQASPPAAPLPEAHKAVQ